MKKLILKLKVKKYLRFAKKMHKLNRSIRNKSKISLSFTDYVGDIQVCDGYFDLFKLVKPQHGKFENHSKKYKYKHTFYCDGVKLFYLTGGMNENKTV